MRRHLWASVLPIVLLLVLMAWPAQASSKPCPVPADLATVDLMVLGEVIWKPFPRIYLVRVDRYYKGTGKRYFLAEEDDTYPGEWERQSKNETMVMGFRQAAWGPTWGFCKFRAAPDDPQVTPLKPGIAPEPGIDLRLRLSWIDIAMIAALLLASVLALRWLVRWAIHKRAAPD